MLTLILFVAAVAASIYFGIEYANRSKRLAELAAQHGTKSPPPYLPASIGGWKRYLEVTGAIADRKALEKMVQDLESFGATHSANMMGTPFIVTMDPENIKTVLSTKFADYGLGHRLNAFGPLIGQGIFTSDGKHWEHSRAMIRPNFARAQVADLVKLEGNVQRLFSAIPRDGRPVDLQPLFYNMTFDTATEFLVGKSINCQLAREGTHAQAVVSAFDYAQTQMASRMRLASFSFLHRDSKFDRACDTLHEAFDALIADAKKKFEIEGEKQTGDHYVFLKELMRVEKDPLKLRAEALNVLIAGRDTTAGLLSNLFHLLARHPRVWKRLQQEIDTTLEGRLPDYETLRGDLPYLKAVINEGLRLYPSVPTNTRFANVDTVLPRGGGESGTAPILVPKGSVFLYSVYAMHRRKDIYGPDAEEFRPERWIAEENETPLRPGWGFLPFNGGPRICIGQQYALTETGYTVVRMLQTFAEMENCDPRRWQEHIGVTLSSNHGAQVRFQRRL
ncbi:hypothetical protein BST61_g11290 [Cercospora zeina]